MGSWPLFLFFSFLTARAFCGLGAWFWVRILLVELDNAEPRVMGYMSKLDGLSGSAGTAAGLGPD